MPKPCGFGQRLCPDLAAAVNFPEIERIEVHYTLAPFVKLCRFLVLHELINNNLFKTHGKHIEYHSPEFQNQLKRLWDACIWVLNASDSIIAGGFSGLLAGALAWAAMQGEEPPDRKQF